MRVDAPSIGERGSDRPEFGLVSDVLQPPRASRESKIDLDDPAELLDVRTFERRRIHARCRFTVLLYFCRTEAVSDLFNCELHRCQPLN
jgi:hypothetical protein